VDTGTGTEVASTFSTTTSDASVFAKLFFSTQAENRMYSLAMGNEYLDNTKAAAIIAALNTRHGRTYA
jgi:hypothetical protein